MNIEIADTSPAGIEAVQQLWIEYWASLGLPQDFQSFAAERRSLPGAYASPAGRLTRRPAQPT